MPSLLLLRLRCHVQSPEALSFHTAAIFRHVDYSSTETINPDPSKSKNSIKHRPEAFQPISTLLRPCWSPCPVAVRALARDEVARHRLDFPRRIPSIFSKPVLTKAFRAFITEPLELNCSLNQFGRSTLLIQGFCVCLIFGTLRTFRGSGFGSGFANSFEGVTACLVVVSNRCLV